MGWGSPFVSALSAASQAAKNAAHEASQTAQAAWEYTKQKAASAFQSASQATTHATEQVQSATNSAYDSAGEKIAVARDRAAAASQWLEQKSDETSKAVGVAFDNIGKSFAPQPAGSPTKSCPFAKVDRPPPPRGDGTCKAPPPCFKQPLEIRCGHSERKFKLIPPNTPTNHQYDQVIQLVANKNGRDDIEIAFSCGACPFGSGPDLPCLSFSGQKARSAVRASLDGPPSPAMPLQSPDLPGVVPLVEFVRHFILNRDGEGFVSYDGTVDCCQGAPGQSFRVEVYPKREWSGRISASIDVPGSSAKSHSMSRAKLVFKGQLVGSYGVRTFKVSPPSLEIGRYPAGRQLPPSKMAFKATKSFLDTIYPSIMKFKESRYVTIEPEWPNVELGGGSSLSEVKGRYNVSSKGNVSLSLSPLFALAGNFDALQWLIDVACYAYLQPPPFAKLVSDQILYIRRQAEKGIGHEGAGFKVVARLDIAAKGSVGGTLQWDFLPEAKDKASGSLKVDLDITVAGKISAEFRVWKVGYEAGATIAGESGFGGVVSACIYGDDPMVSGKVIFKGLRIKGVAYQSLGGSSVGTSDEGQAAIADRKSAKKKKKKGDSSWWDPFSINTDDAGVADSADWEMVVIEEASWPSEDGGGGVGGSNTPLASSM